MILSALNSRFIILFSIFLVKVQINCLSQVVKCDLFLVQQTVAFSRRLQQLWNWKQNLQFILSLDFHSRPSLIVTDKAVTSVFIPFGLIIPTASLDRKIAVKIIASVICYQTSALVNSLHWLHWNPREECGFWWDTKVNEFWTRKECEFTISL